MERRISVPELRDPDRDVPSAEERWRLDERHARVAPAGGEEDLSVCRRVEPPFHGLARRATPPLPPGQVFADAGRADEVPNYREGEHEGLAAGRVREILATADVVAADRGRPVELRLITQKRSAVVASSPVDQATHRPNLHGERRRRRRLAVTDRARRKVGACDRCGCGLEKRGQACGDGGGGENGERVLHEYSPPYVAISFPCPVHAQHKRNKPT